MCDILFAGVLQDYSREDILVRSVNLKECLIRMKDISSYFQIPLCYGTQVMYKIRMWNIGIVLWLVHSTVI